MEITETKQEKLDLATLLATQSKQVQLLNNDEDVVIPDECGDTLWDKVLAQYEKTDTHK
ncbi:hypothetical protein [Arcicella lustrica]|uniref:Uncharacterized protein n=1 Tax=Arcicella lustrica TaxID=2984196 RepID=A0ABU5SKX0_9BACT|nr:hypothetical protein [Arcicella sp. DC25W]MEA5427948.1 hypothetical protein [Arcicella sp. DC25W]